MNVERVSFCSGSVRRVPRHPRNNHRGIRLATNGDGLPQGRKELRGIPQLPLYLLRPCLPRDSLDSVPPSGCQKCRNAFWDSNRCPGQLGCAFLLGLGNPTVTWIGTGLLLR